MTKAEKKAYDAQYYQEHKEHIKKRNKQYYNDNKAAVAKRAAAWYADKMQRAADADAIAAENERLRAQLAQLAQLKQAQTQQQ